MINNNSDKGNLCDPKNVTVSIWILANMEIVGVPVSAGLDDAMIALMETALNNGNGDG